VKTLKLEPTTYCNIRCPACPVAKEFVLVPALRQGRAHKFLPLDVMIDVVEQLPDLQTLLFYNFGEPFLHKEAIPFLREVRRRRPAVYIATNTNGLVLTPAQIEALATEALLDKIVFSIDGAYPSSYRKYRVGGDLAMALRKLGALVSACRSARTLGRTHIAWQYILFKWNDSNEELSLAKELAREMGVPIEWVIPFGEEASERFTPGSADFDRLSDGGDFSNSMSVPKRLAYLTENGGVGLGRYLARITTKATSITAPAGARTVLTVDVENLTDQDWVSRHPNGFHIGVSLLTPSGRKIRELPGVELPPGAARAHGRDSTSIDVTLPEEYGQYQLLIDVVHNGVCWFFERGSQPLLCLVNAEQTETIDSSRVN
jgi:pyruvate-formate lyase-activating enzyme